MILYITECTSSTFVSTIKKEILSGFLIVIMAFKAKLSLAILLLSVLVLCALAIQEGGRDDDEWSLVNPRKQLEHCKKQCERQQGGQQRQLCRFRCQEKWKQEQEREGEGNKKKEREEEEEEEEENPYVFEEKHFTSRVESEHGRVDVLQRFAKKSKLLRGLENYRVAVLTANPQTFVSPNHWDADGVLFVAKGRATITMVRENKRESFNLECGDIIKVPSGTPVYIINRDENEKLYILKFLKPVNIPDQFEAFYGPGGENPESFYRAFSWDILEAAFKTDRSRLEKLFSQQKEGSIIKASKEEIQSMSQHEEGGGIWPFAGESSRGPINLFKQRPSQSNNYGELLEVDSNDYRPLEDLNVMVSFANFSEGAMSAYYNSKATKISFVIRGEGYFEMACPHVASSGSSGRHRGSGSSRRQEGGPSYQKISSRLKVGTVFIVPAGHPIMTVASKNNNLQILCFEVNAQGNIRYPLAGQGNIIKLMESEAKELAFNTKAQEVDQVFGKQDLKFFFPGPNRQQEQEETGRAYE